MRRSLVFGLLVLIVACGDDATPLPESDGGGSDAGTSPLVDAGDLPSGPCPRVLNEPVGLSVATGIEKSSWLEVGFFVEFAGSDIRREMYEEIGPGGMHAVGPPLTLEASDFDDYKQRLENAGDLHERLAQAQAAGSSVVYQLEITPRWMSPRPDDERLACPDEPWWANWGTVAPAAEHRAAWAELVEWTVGYLTITRGYDHLWFQLWEEPEGPCYWTDTEEAYLELYARTAAAVKRANPSARIGGPGATELDGTIEPSTTPLVQRLIERAAADSLPLDFVSFHLFGYAPHAARNTAVRADAWLDAAGFADTPILITSYNPLDSASSPFWPRPGTPSPSGRIYEYDTEIGAAYAPALSLAMSELDRPGYLTMFQLDDFSFGGEYESDSAWGTRTPEERNGIRKAMYQGMRLQSLVSDELVAARVDDPRTGTDGALGPLGALAGTMGSDVYVLVWSYVAAPEDEANAVVVEAGYAGGLRTWDRAALERFIAGATDVTAVTADPADQRVLEAAKRVFLRQRDLAGRSRPLCIEVPGSTEVLETYVVDAEHNNSHGRWRASGLDDAIAATCLRPSDGFVTRSGTCWHATVAPYSVLALRLGATSIPGEIVVRALDP